MLVYHHYLAFELRRVLWRLLLAVCFLLTIDAVSAKSQLTVVSLNLQGKGESEALASELKQLQETVGCDVILLQEVSDQSIEASDLFYQRLGEPTGLKHLYSPPPHVNQGKVSPRLAILSKHPIKYQKMIPMQELDLVFKSRKRYALDAVIESPHGPIRVFNLHLDSRINSEDRILQLEPVLTEASPETIPVVIGGDFNSNNYYWLFHLLPIPFVSNQKGSLLDHLADKDFTTPFLSSDPTHDVLRLQLDWVFGRRVAWIESGVVPVDFSDHHLIWAQFIPDEQPPGLPSQSTEADSLRE